MRISASSTMLALALFGTAGLQGVTADAPNPADWFSAFDPFSAAPEGSPAAIAGANLPRCIAADITKVTSTESDKIVGVIAPLAEGILPAQLLDGCIATWGGVKGSRRERATLYEAPAYSECDSTKVTVRGTGFEQIPSGKNATVSTTTTLVGEALKAAWSYSASVANRRTGFSAPAFAVANRYYEDVTTYPFTKDIFSAHGLCPDSVTVPANPGTNLTCSIDADFTISSASFDYTIANPTGSDMRGLKAVLTFAKNVTLRRMYLPRGSARVQLPTIEGNRTAKAGDALITTSVTIPLASRNLASKGALTGSMFWDDVDQPLNNVAASTDVKLVVTRGRTVVCDTSIPSR